VHVFYTAPSDYYWSGFDLFLKSSTDNGLTWSNANHVTYSGGVEETTPKAAAANGTNVYVAYADRTTGDIYFKKSTDSGISWSAPTRLTYIGNLDDYGEPSLVYSPGTGYFHIISGFYVDSTYYGELYYKRGH